MAQIRKTTYVCDGCGKVVDASRDLSKFTIAWHGTRGDGWKESINFELCGECEANFLTIMGDYVREEEKDTVTAMAR